MNSKWLLALCFLLLVSQVHAKEITFSLDQTEYFFKVGEEAIILLQSESTYSSAISGQLSYTITQSINQAGFQYSSTNAQSTSFSVDIDKTDIPLHFGVSDTPTSLSVDLKFSYMDKDPREISLSNIQINFVTDESAKNNQQNKQTSSSQKQQSPFPEQKNDKNQPSTQERLQNNQLSQDSSALKQQIQKQLQEQQQMQQDFQKQLEQNQQLQSHHQQLLDQEFKHTGENINPTSNNSGDFELQYDKPNGEKASITGQMSNGQMQNIQTQSSKSDQQLLDQLKQHEDFKKFQNQLQKEGFTEKKTEFSKNNNQTNINIDYLNDNNQTASIKAEMVNNTVQEVHLTKETNRVNWWLLLIAIIFCYVVYLKFFKPMPTLVKTEKNQEPFDHKAAAVALLNSAEKLFEIKQFKDAYAHAAQGLRLYLSYENSLEKETTNDEIIDQLKLHKKPYKTVKECFDLCSFVEFAKYKANQEDFNKIINSARKVVK